MGKPKRIIRDRYLTPEEVARDNEIRRKVMAEFPPLTDRSLVHMKLAAIKYNLFEGDTGNLHMVTVHPLELSNVSEEFVHRLVGDSREDAEKAACAWCDENGYVVLPANCYVATVQVVVHAESAGAACDWFSETLRGADGLVDWAYHNVQRMNLTPVDSNGYCCPAEILIPEDYSEGMAFEKEKT